MEKYLPPGENPAKKECPEQRKNANTCDSFLATTQHEIDSAYNYVRHQKDTCIAAIKIFLVLLAGLFGYGAYMAQLDASITSEQNAPAAIEAPPQAIEQFSARKKHKTIDGKIEKAAPAGGPAKAASRKDLGLAPYEVIGLIISISVFLAGWTLTLLLMHTTTFITLAYKHIYSMRGLKEKCFPCTAFNNRAIYATEAGEVPNYFSRLMLFALFIINISTLLTSYYFVYLPQRNEFEAFIYTSAIFSICLPLYFRHCQKIYIGVIAAKAKTTNETLEASKDRIRDAIKKKANSYLLRLLNAIWIAGLLSTVITILLIFLQYNGDDERDLTDAFFRYTSKGFHFEYAYLAMGLLGSGAYFLILAQEGLRVLTPNKQFFTIYELLLAPFAIVIAWYFF